MPEEINIIQIQKLVDEFLIIMCNPKNSRCSVVDFLEEKFPEMSHKERANLKVKINTIIEEEKIGIKLENNEYKIAPKGCEVIARGGYVKYNKRENKLSNATNRSNKISIVIAVITLLGVVLAYFEFIYK